MTKTIIRRRIPIALLAALLFAVRPAAADTLTLMWDYNTEPEVNGYRVYIGTQSGVYTQTVDVQNTDRYVFSSAAPGQNYCFAVVAYAGALVSPLSNEVCGMSNGYPVLTQPASQTSTVGQSVSLQLVGSDPNGDALTYSASGLPAGLMITQSLGLISGVPTTAGTYTVTASVSDGSLTASRSFSWTVNAANAAPTLTAPGNQTGTVGVAAVLQLQASDANGDTLTYSATGLPTGLSIAASTGRIAGTPSAAGTFNVTATVSDGKATANRSFTWTIAPANVAPTMTQPANQSGTVGVAASLQLQASDANGDTLTYSVTGLPSGLSLTASTGLIAGTPTTAGTYNVSVTVSDGVLAVSRSFTWTVVPANAAPTLTQPANQSGTVGVAASLQLQASDANGDTLTYSAAGLPVGLSITTSTGRIAGTPTAIGTFNVTATVSDGKTSVSRSFTWTIVHADAVPMLTQPANQSGTVGIATALQLQASDPNGDPLTYAATGLPAGLSINAGTGHIAGTPTTAGTYTVTATVSNGKLSASRSFTWTIAPANVAPTMTQPANQSGTVGVAAALQLQASDANGDTLTYSASGLPAGLSINAGTGLIAGTPTTTGTYNVTATVSDGRASDSRSFTWTVTAVQGSTGNGNGNGKSSAPGQTKKATAESTYTGESAAARVSSDDASIEDGRTTTSMTRKPKSSTVVSTSMSGSTSVDSGYTGSGALTRSMASNAFVSTAVNAALASQDLSPELLGTMAVSRSEAVTVTAPRIAPTVSIHTPVDGASLGGGRTVIFSGAAHDATDGDLSGTIVWTSNIDGRLGLGAMFHRELSRGTHVVTAVVTNSQGHIRTAQVTIVVK